MSIKTLIQNHGRWFLGAAMGIGVFAYFLWKVPFLLLAREQSQLFLWNIDYLRECMVVPGGLAQYLADMIVQVFLNPLYGALWLAALFVIIQLMTFRLMGAPKRWYLFLLSAVPAWLMAYLWTDIHVSITLTVAVVLALAGACVLRRWRYQLQLWALVVLMPVGYWLIGPAIVLTLIPLLTCWKRLWPVGALTLWLVGCMVASARVVDYPLAQVVRGIDYYWDDDKLGTYEEMNYDMLVRQQRWAAIVNLYQAQPTESLAIRDVVSVAMWKLQQIDHQEMLSHLTLSNRTLSSISAAFLMSEVSMQIGMVNIAQRAAFEAMEAAPNYHKSARALRRLVETNMVTSQPEVALKYIAILEQTTFYRGWARRMKAMVEQPALLEQHPYYKSLKDFYEHEQDVFFY